ncbi:MAG: TIGR04150 pseudo-rSAM protein [Bacteroidales bacterium]|jgi:pseudo-rSAM protein|nr:TIGR04150 pseudo-rSAM protein [Bacteroidales bacterium]
MEQIWFYLEPYIFISDDENKFLFYNTNTSQGLLFEKNDVINKTVKHLQNPVNMYSILIDVKDMKNSDLYNLIVSLQEAGYGDVIEGDLTKPVIMPPVLNLQKSVERLKKNNMPTGDNILSYLHEVTIYINGNCHRNCNECRHLFKQLPFCTISDNILDFEELNSFLSSIAYTYTNINITGGNPFQYPKLYELLDVLGKRFAMQTFIINYKNIPDDINVLYIFSFAQFRLKIVVSGIYQIEEMMLIADKLRQGKINQLWEIAITSIDEFEKAEQLNVHLSERDIEVEIKPFYTTNNLSFFEENIFLRQEDIISVNLDRQDVFALQALNTNDFGKLVILSDGKVYANVNQPSIGYFQEPIWDILCRELENGKSWRNTRYNISPCNQCCFKLICPSPSNYELVIGKPNLCHVKP